MKKMIGIGCIGVLLLLGLLPGSNAYDTGLITDQHDITIMIADTNLMVEEHLALYNREFNNITSIRVWVQADASNINIVSAESGEELDSLGIESNIWECNLSAYGLDILPDQRLNLRLTYNLPTETQSFSKTLVYDTSSLSITYEDNELYRGEQNEGQSIQILLHTPIEAPANLLYIIIIFILVIILVASTLLLMRKQRSRVKQSLTESKETLETKKGLMLSILKDIEKKHRAKEISDETYQKLKEEFKQQAVDVMKKLDDV